MYTGFPCEMNIPIRRQLLKGKEKQKMVAEEGTGNAFRLAKKYKIKTAWGTDMLFDPKSTKNRGAILTTLTAWYTPFEILKWPPATQCRSCWPFAARVILIQGAG